MYGKVRKQPVTLTGGEWCKGFFHVVEHLVKYPVIIGRGSIDSISHVSDPCNITSDGGKNDDDQYCGCLFAKCWNVIVWYLALYVKQNNNEKNNTGRRCKDIFRTNGNKQQKQ